MTWGSTLNQLRSSKGRWIASADNREVVTGPRLCWSIEKAKRVMGERKGKIEAEWDGGKKNGAFLPREFLVILKSVFVPRNREGACLQECKSQTQANRAERTKLRRLRPERWLRCHVKFHSRYLHSRRALRQASNLIAIDASLSCLIR